MRHGAAIGSGTGTSTPGTSSPAAAVAQRVYRRMLAMRAVPGQTAVPAAPTCDLLVLDRSSDVVAPVAREWTYEAMVHDLLQVRRDRAEICAEICAKICAEIALGDSPRLAAGAISARSRLNLGSISAFNLLQVQGDRYEYKYVGNNNQQLTKEVLLNESDPLWPKY